MGIPGGVLRVFSLILWTGPLLAIGLEAFNGRWNIEVKSKERPRAWWLEIQGAGTQALRGRFVGAPGGGMYDIPEMRFEGDTLVFVFQRRYGVPGERVQYDQIPERRGIYRARLEGDRLIGTFEVEGFPQTRLEWVGFRAPEIPDRDDGTWRPTQPVELFNGRDLTGWKPLETGRPLGWVVEDGILKNVPPAANLVSEQMFWNFELYAEYRLQKGSNSGIGLRGRYEIQIIDDYGRPPSVQSHGAVYSRIAPKVNASKPPGEWQSLRVRLIGREVTVILNGIPVIERGIIEGLTAMGHDPYEDRPGPISIQGDHREIEIRKLTVTPLVR